MFSRNQFFWQNLAIVGLLSACGAGKDSDTGDTGDTGQSENILVQGIHQQLSNSSGCGDIAMVASTGNDQAALFIVATGLAEEAYAEGTESSSFSLDVGQAEGQARLWLQGGERLTVEFCNDVIMEEYRPDVQEEMPAISGSIDFVIHPSGEATDWGEFPANATVELHNVVFSLEESDASPITVDGWGFESYVGWFPG